MRLRILTYNIHKCIGGLDFRYRPERVLQTIAHYEPDIVMLQEVDDMVRRSNWDRQVDLLGREIGLRHRTWFPNVKIRAGGEYGNAILSRFPIMSTENIDVTRGWRKPRSVLHARFRVRPENAKGRRTRTVHVFNMHLGLAESERRWQLERFLASRPFAGLHGRTPIIVAGDFNDVYGTLGGQLLAPAGFAGAPKPVLTFPAYAPIRALDSIYVRGDLQMNRVFRSQLKVAKVASDHLPLGADLRIR